MFEPAPNGCITKRMVSSLAAKAAQLLEGGDPSLGARFFVNPSNGDLLLKVHPMATINAIHVIEGVSELQGHCGNRQVRGARVGLMHASGGGISGFDHYVCPMLFFWCKR